MPNLEISLSPTMAAIYYVIAMSLLLFAVIRSRRGKAMGGLLVPLVAFLIFRFGVRPPIPESLMRIFMGIVVGATLLYVSSAEEPFGDLDMAVRELLGSDGPGWLAGLRRALLGLTPLYVAGVVFINLTPKATPPAELRAIHPAPPTSITVRGEKIRLQEAVNPFWPDSSVPPDPEVIREGGEIYAANCVYCHGDALDGEGTFKEGLNPVPANFVDVGTIAQLQQSYLLWRIAKGGVGLPNESAPWASAMPAWEESLTIDEMWKVIAFLYYQTGHSPRTWEE